MLGREPPGAVGGVRGGHSQPAADRVDERRVSRLGWPGWTSAIRFERMLCAELWMLPCAALGLPCGLMPID